SVAWLARLDRDQEVASSNLAAPTIQGTMPRLRLNSSSDENRCPLLFLFRSIVLQALEQGLDIAISTYGHPYGHEGEDAECTEK
ncbi:MAG: hypothetical protein ACO3PO_08530, partial [Limisphaerales bacterium]